MSAGPHRDSESLGRLEDLRPVFERLKADRIRAESDIERLTRELDEARRLARQELGTDDEDEIRRMIAAAEAETEAAVAAFSAALEAVAAKLADLEEKA